MSVPIDTTRTAWYVGPLGQQRKTAQAGPYASPEAVINDIFERRLPLAADGSVPVYQFHVPSREETAACWKQAQQDIAAIRPENYRAWSPRMTAGLGLFAAIGGGMCAASLGPLGVAFVSGLMGISVTVVYERLVLTMAESRAKGEREARLKEVEASCAQGWRTQGHLRPVRPDPLGPVTDFAYQPVWGRPS